MYIGKVNKLEDFSGEVSRILGLDEKWIGFDSREKGGVEKSFLEYFSFLHEFCLWEYPYLGSFLRVLENFFSVLVPDLVIKSGCD